MSRPGSPMALSDESFIDTCIDTIRLVRASFLAYLLVYVLAVDAAAEQGRQRGPLPAAGPQRVGPGREAVEGAGRLQLRPGGARDPGGAGAAGRVGNPAPGAGEGGGRRRGGAGVRRVPAAGRHLGAGRAVGA